MSERVHPQEPLSRIVAARAVGRCALRSAQLLGQRKAYRSKQNVGLHLRFGDGTTGRIFRETIVDQQPPADPCLLIVGFRLRLLRGSWHKVFLWECILNTPLFVGFPGFVSKLWLDRDERELYRGLYEWSDAAGAEFYARSLWRVLELVCPRGAIYYKVVPGFRRDRVLERPQMLESIDPGEGSAWWRLVSTC